MPGRIRARRDADRGAAMVEFALLAPVLVMMLLGIITSGLSYNRANSLNNGARESARYGATLPVGADMPAWLNAVADVARDSTTGTLEPGTPGKQICVAYVYPDGSDADDSTFAIIETGSGRMIAPGVTCFTDGRPDGERRVQVLLARTSEVQTGFYGKTLDLDARSVTRYERA